MDHGDPVGVTLNLCLNPLTAGRSCSRPAGRKVAGRRDGGGGREILWEKEGARDREIKRERVMRVKKREQMSAPSILRKHPPLSSSNHPPLVCLLSEQSGRHGLYRIGACEKKRRICYKSVPSIVPLGRTALSPK